MKRTSNIGHRTSLPELVRAAGRASRFSYSPYSKLKVGAAMLAASGKIYLGCNIENASFSATVCAERVALFKALSEGERKFNILAIASNAKKTIYPCGVCRQVLGELAGDIDILIRQGRRFKNIKLSKLYPKPFHL